ncbi:RNA-directed DNA polymerase, eukaryota, reverse transcriptase zinc-binding domain protein [Tanacetum coccineum]
MYSIASWNIRGLNHTPKQKEVRQVMNENCLNVCAILESHVDIGKLEKVCSKVCNRWKWSSNRSFCSKGSRIILGWNDDIVDVLVLSCSSQEMHTQIILKSDHKALFCTFVYASNSYDTCHQLWKSLEVHKHFVQGRPWVILGDFNSARFIEDMYAGSKDTNISMREFNACISDIEVEDLNSTCLHFTWNKKPRAERGILKKIDRVMCNIDFNTEYPGSYAIFQPYRISNHAHAVLKIHKVTKDKPKPFKFFNFLVYKPEFMDMVNEHWGVNSQGNLHERVVKLRHELDEVQNALDKDPFSLTLREEETTYLSAFTQAALNEERFLKQKSKIE